MQHASNLSLKFMNDFSPKLDNKQEIIQTNGNQVLRKY